LTDLWGGEAGQVDRHFRIRLTIPYICAAINLTGNIVDLLVGEASEKHVAGIKPGRRRRINQELGFYNAADERQDGVPRGLVALLIARNVSTLVGEEVAKGSVTADINLEVKARSAVFNQDSASIQRRDGMRGRAILT
jgi:hypothetical protein